MSAGKQADDSPKSASYLQGRLDSLEYTTLPMIQEGIRQAQEDVKPVKHIRLGIWAVGVALLLFGAGFGTFVPLLFSKVSGVNQQADDLSKRLAQIEIPVKQWEAQVEKSKKEYDAHAERKQTDITRQIEEDLRRKFAHVRSVEVGMAVPYFSTADVPPGFVEIKPGNQWPQVDWLPEELRGTDMMPGVEAWLIGGATGPYDVGTVWDKGSLSISGSEFTINRSDEKRLTSGFASDATYTYGMFGFEPNNAQHAQILGNEFDDIEIRNIGKRRPRVVKPIAHSYQDSTPGTISGTAKVPLNSRDALPVHLMCRWILRYE
ncbi:MAG: hypothetical protein JXB62_09635 [Pirellulales bacterium]|nr:hypothetical protein [Pirellulales bacterium]